MKLKYLLHEFDSSEYYELGPTTDLKSMVENIKKICFEYANRDVAFNAVYTYINQHNAIAKQLITKYNITDKEHLKRFVGKLHSIARKGKMKQLKADAINAQVDDIIDKALQAFAEK